MTSYSADLESAIAAFREAFPAGVVDDLGRHLPGGGCEAFAGLLRAIGSPDATDALLADYAAYAELARRVGEQPGHETYVNAWEAVLGESAGEET